jgi:hypothetical protein
VMSRAQRDVSESCGKKREDFLPGLPNRRFKHDGWKQMVGFRQKHSGRNLRLPCKSQLLITGRVTHRDQQRDPAPRHLDGKSVIWTSGFVTAKVRDARFPSKWILLVSE